MDETKETLKAVILHSEMLNAKVDNLDNRLVKVQLDIGELKQELKHQQDKTNVRLDKIEESQELVIERFDSVAETQDQIVELQEETIARLERVEGTQWEINEELVNQHEWLNRFW